MNGKNSIHIFVLCAITDWIVFDRSHASAPVFLIEPNPKSHNGSRPHESQDYFAD